MKKKTSLAVNELKKKKMGATDGGGVMVFKQEGVARRLLIGI